MAFHFVLPEELKARLLRDAGLGPLNPNWFELLSEAALKRRGGCPKANPISSSSCKTPKDKCNDNSNIEATPVTSSTWHNNSNPAVFACPNVQSFIPSLTPHRIALSLGVQDDPNLTWTSAFETPPACSAFHLEHHSGQIEKQQVDGESSLTANVKANDENTQEVLNAIFTGTKRQKNDAKPPSGQKKKVQTPSDWLCFSSPTALPVASDSLDTSANIIWNRNTSSVSNNRKGGDDPDFHRKCHTKLQFEEDSVSNHEPYSSRNVGDMSGCWLLDDALGTTFSKGGITVKTDCIQVLNKKENSIDLCRANGTLEDSEMKIRDEKVGIEQATQVGDMTIDTIPHGCELDDSIKKHDAIPCFEDLPLPAITTHEKKKEHLSNNYLDGTSEILLKVETTLRNGSNSICDARSEIKKTFNNVLFRRSVINDASEKVVDNLHGLDQQSELELESNVCYSDTKLHDSKIPPDHVIEQLKDQEDIFGENNLPSDIEPLSEQDGLSVHCAVEQSADVKIVNQEREVEPNLKLVTSDASVQLKADAEKTIEQFAEVSSLHPNTISAVLSLGKRKRKFQYNIQSLATVVSSPCVLNTNCSFVDSSMASKSTHQDAHSPSIENAAHSGVTTLSVCKEKQAKLDQRKTLPSRILEDASKRSKSSKYLGEKNAPYIPTTACGAIDSSFGSCSISPILSSANVVQFPCAAKTYSTMADSSTPKSRYPPSELAVKRRRCLQGVRLSNELHFNEPESERQSPMPNDPFVDSNQYHFCNAMEGEEVTKDNVDALDSESESKVKANRVKTTASFSDVEEQIWVQEFNSTDQMSDLSLLEVIDGCIHNDQEETGEACHSSAVILNPPNLSEKSPVVSETSLFSLYKMNVEQKSGLENVSDLQTASANPIVISTKALNNNKNTFSGIENACCDELDEVNHKSKEPGVLPNLPDDVHKFGTIGDSLLSDVVEDAVDKDRRFVSPHCFSGFQTANQKCITVSAEAMTKAQSLMQDVMKDIDEPNLFKVLCDRSKMFPLANEMPTSTGSPTRDAFLSLSDKMPKIWNSSMESNKLSKGFQPFKRPSLVKDFPGVHRSALDLFQERRPDAEKTNCMQLPLSKEGSISCAHLDKMLIKDDVTTFPSGFETASKKSISLSFSSLQRARKILGDIDEIPSLCNQVDLGHDVDVNSGFEEPMHDENDKKHPLNISLERSNAQHSVILAIDQSSAFPREELTGSQMEEIEEAMSALESSYGQFKSNPGKPIVDSLATFSDCPQSEGHLSDVKYPSVSTTFDARCKDASLIRFSVPKAFAKFPTSLSPAGGNSVKVSETVFPKVSESFSHDYCEDEMEPHLYMQSIPQLGDDKGENEPTRNENPVVKQTVITVSEVLGGGNDISEHEGEVKSAILEANVSAIQLPVCDSCEKSDIDANQCKSQCAEEECSRNPAHSATYITDDMSKKEISTNLAKSNVFIHVSKPLLANDPSLPVKTEHFPSIEVKWKGASCFTTAGGKAVRVQKSSLQSVKHMFSSSQVGSSLEDLQLIPNAVSCQGTCIQSKDENSNGNWIDGMKSSEIESCAVAFHTASGKSITVSDEALNTARGLLQESMYCEEQVDSLKKLEPKHFQLKVPSKQDYGLGKPAGNVDLNICEEGLPNSTAESYFPTFSTSRGVDTGVSADSLQHACKLRENLNEDAEKIETVKSSLPQSVMPRMGENETNLYHGLSDDTCGRHSNDNGNELMESYSRELVFNQAHDESLQGFLDDEFIVQNNSQEITGNVKVHTEGRKRRRSFEAEQPDKRKLVSQFENEIVHSKVARPPCLSDPNHVLGDRCCKQIHSFILKPFATSPFSDTCKKQCSFQNAHDENICERTGRSESISEASLGHAGHRRKAFISPFHVTKPDNASDDPTVGDKCISVGKTSFRPPFPSGLPADDAAQASASHAQSRGHTNLQSNLSRNEVTPDIARKTHHAVYHLDTFPLQQDHDDDCFTAAEMSARLRCTRELQKLRLARKKQQTVQPQPGSLSLKKACGGSRVSLRDAVAGQHPYFHSRQQLQAYGADPHLTSITSATAEEFRFDCALHFSRVALRAGNGIVLADGGCLVPADDCTVGKNEFYQALLDTPGVEERLVSSAWTYNHYRWLVWKLAALEASFPSVFVGHCLTPESILLQLKYRYDVEVDNSRRSALKRIVERDDTPSRTLILLLSRIITKSDERAPILAGTSATKQAAECTALMPGTQVEVSDGWYGLRANIDAPLSQLLRRGRLRVGQKLIVHGAELVGSNEACSPLEAPSSLALHLSANGTRLARWDTHLGYFRDPRPFPVPLSSLFGDGGMVRCVDLVVLRSYPMQWMEKLPSGAFVFRNDRAEAREGQCKADGQERRLEALYSKLEEQFEKDNQAQIKPQSVGRFSEQHIQALEGGSELYEAMLASTDPAYVESCLSEQQLRALQEYRQVLADRRRSQLQAELRQALSSIEEFPTARDVTPIWKILVAGYADPGHIPHVGCQLSVWRPQDELKEQIKEGHRLRAYHLAVTPGRRCASGGLKLSATKKSKFLPLDALGDQKSKVYHPREVVPFEAFSRPSFRAFFHEVDVVGFVINVDAKQSQMQAVYLGSPKGELVVLRVWGGLEQHAAHELVRPGALLAVSNLQWTGERHSSLPALFAGEIASFSLGPKQVHLREACAKLSKAVPDVDTFIQAASDKLFKLLNIGRPSGSLHRGLQKQIQTVNTTAVTQRPSGTLLRPCTPETTNSPNTPFVMKDKLRCKKSLSLLNRIPSPPPLTTLTTTATVGMQRPFRPPRSTTPGSKKPPMPNTPVSDKKP
uniref:breast cancer type 2 susceptibility protein n=1 Tax=Myxine glutinosa TaxID=7769 RepID=UPI00358E0953